MLSWCVVRLAHESQYRIPWRVSVSYFCVHVISGLAAIQWHRIRCEDVCPILKNDISQLAEEVWEQVLYENKRGMEKCGEGLEMGKDSERIVGGWRCAAAEGDAGGWGESQHESPSKAIYSSPSWVILPGPDPH